jgi:uncharacterized protein
MLHDTMIADTQRWLERAVIGLNLCPFAKAEHVHGRIRYSLSDALDTQALLDDMRSELLALQAADPAQCETTLLVHPMVLQDFLDYNDFLGEADALLQELELDGVLQIASFHPQYQFGGTSVDDIENYTNRAPYPTLHILREASVERAVQSFPDAEMIYERNIATLKKLGLAGWKKMLA